MNSTSYCTSVELEHHRGPCRCECLRNRSSCHLRQQFLPNSCSCQCLPSLASEKSVCNNSSVHRWDSDTCQCRCKHVTRCQACENVNTTSCQCQALSSTECSLSREGNVYIVNIALLVAMLLVIIFTIIYLIRFSIRMRRTIRYSSNTLYQQDNSERNPMINGYTIRMSKDGNISELIGPNRK